MTQSASFYWNRKRKNKPMLFFLFFPTCQVRVVRFITVVLLLLLLLG